MKFLKMNKPLWIYEFYKKWGFYPICGGAFSITYVFSPNTVISSSNVNTNFSNVVTGINAIVDYISAGTITNAMLAQITTAGKVSGAALTSLDAIPSEAGDIPSVNLDGNACVLTGDQTIAGIKTFSSIPVLPASDPTTDNQTARKAYVDTKATKGANSDITSLAGLTTPLSRAQGGTGTAKFQSGRASVANGGTVTYPTTMGDTSYTLLIMPEGVDGGIYDVSSKSAIGFVYYTNSAGTHTVHWLAIHD